ncbi:MAG TPA: AraC family transcriptional regulator [Burkholderiales bacterium]|nr:AraC family transcriptional regulator [Burkholderiales bacterium]
MNAPYPAALLQPPEAPLAVEPWTIRPESVRLTSRSLGWPLNIERREVEPSSHWLPGGTTHHLVFVSLAQGRCVRASEEELTETQFEAGQVSIHPAFKPVRWEWDTRLSFVLLWLEPQFLEKVAEEVFDLSPEAVVLKAVEGQRDPFITQMAGLLIREVVNGDAASSLLAASAATQLAIHLLRHYSARPQPAPAGRGLVAPRAVTLATQFIHENYARDISLTDIAAAAHLSPFHLARLFKKATGRTTHQYLVEIRVNSARALLTAGAGARSLADVAAAVGFADQSHLTRHFKRVLGMTPGQIKQ